MKFMLLINVGISTFNSRINGYLWLYTPEISIEFGCFSIYEQDQIHAHLFSINFMLNFHEYQWGEAYFMANYHIFIVTKISY